MTTLSHHSQDAHQHAPPTDSTGLIGQVLVLVAVAVGFAAVGAFVGRELTAVVAITVTLAACGMLVIQALGGQRFTVGNLALGWLYAVALAIGLGVGPVLPRYTSADPSAITDAAVTTALVVAAMGASGLSLSKDLASWLRPPSWAVPVLLVVIVVAHLIGSGGNPVLSISVAGIFAILILVDFNYLRRHGTADDAVLLATGIFVSGVNIFLSLSDLFRRP